MITEDECKKRIDIVVFYGKLITISVLIIGIILGTLVRGG